VGQHIHRAGAIGFGVLIEYLPVGEAVNYYHEFKFRIISELPQTNFDIVINLRQEIEEIIKLKIIK